MRRVPVVAWIASALVALPLLATPSAAAGKKTIIKFASLVPENAPGMDMIKDVDKRLEEETGGAVRMRFYLGVAGDEKDIVRKMRINQLGAAQLTGVGLAEIVPEIHVLDLPFFFDQYGEVDHVYDALLPHFQEAFREKGFEFLGFVETGFVYLYSQKKLNSMEDLRNAKIWAWEGDPLTHEFVKAGNLQAVPLGPPDVLTSLQTGLIDTVYGPPLGVLALQWHTKVKYVQPIPFVHATGGVIMNAKTWADLGENQEKVRAEFLSTSKDLTKKLRDINEESKTEIAKSGVETLPAPDPAAVEEFKALSKTVQNSVAGDLYPKELLERVISLRDEWRAQSAAAKPAEAKESESAKTSAETPAAQPATVAAAQP